jgi:hypothetical protein
MNLIPGPMKQTGDWQKAIIRQLAPHLLEVPYYKPSRLQRIPRFARTIRRGLRFRRLDRRVAAI